MTTIEAVKFVRNVMFVWAVVFAVACVLVCVTHSLLGLILVPFVVVFVATGINYESLRRSLT